MPGRICDLCVWKTTGSMSYDKRMSLCKKIVSGADFFGFYSLPDELKIKIHICSEAEFTYKKQEIHMYESDSVIAFSCDVNNIFVLEYRNLKNKYSLNAYEAVIVHECIHAFQAYYSMIPPKYYVWLYESVACYLAKQNKSYDEKKLVSWDTFINDFYTIKDCYGLAYNFGKEVFKRFGDEVLRVIKEPEKYTDQLMEVYNSEIKSQNPPYFLLNRYMYKS